EIILLTLALCGYFAARCEANAYDPGPRYCNQGEYVGVIADETITKDFWHDIYDMSYAFINTTKKKDASAGGIIDGIYNCEFLDNKANVERKWKLV
ncbi:MAG: hypothetical protein LUD41_07935, partial [Phascolarctobacterium sp.]|nr:hypothetical protein [Phascolarctobacterium sp.]